MLKGDTGGYTLPSNLDHSGVAWTEMSTKSTAWVTPGHACLCANKYGHGELRRKLERLRARNIDNLLTRPLEHSVLRNGHHCNRHSLRGGNVCTLKKTSPLLHSSLWLCRTRNVTNLFNSPYLHAFLWYELRPEALGCPPLGHRCAAWSWQRTRPSKSTTSSSTGGTGTLITCTTNCCNS